MRWLITARVAMDGHDADVTGGLWASHFRNTSYCPSAMEGLRRCCSRRMTMAVLRARPARYPVCSASVPMLPMDCQTPGVERTAILLEILWSREPCVETFSSHPPAPEDRGRRGSRDLPLPAVTVAGHRQRNGQNGGASVAGEEGRDPGDPGSWVLHDKPARVLRVLGRVW